MKPLSGIIGGLLLASPGALFPSGAPSGPPNSELRNPNIIFILAQDPSEMTDLAAVRPEKVRDLLGRLDQFSKEAIWPILKPEQETAR